MRIFALSDIHVDYDENAQWIRDLSLQEYSEDTLILAGDISDSLDRISECFEHAVKKFRHVFFVPGNHDIWVNKERPFCSLEKFHQTLALAKSFGIVTERAKVGDYVIHPLFSWYDYSFGAPSDYIKMAWMDFKRCQWPDFLTHPKEISDHFLSLNALPIPTQGEAQNVITFSHFLPRIDLMPAYIPAKMQELYAVLGSIEIEKKLRLLSPKIHVYGHSHLNRDMSIEGVRYINNAFGYPGEERITRKYLIDILA
ncbi:MAG: metallophosphoesterase [Agarilytica sp.]